MNTHVGSDGRRNVLRAVPSSEAIYSFRARHREMSSRISGSVSAHRLAAANVSHFGSLHEVLRNKCTQIPEFRNNSKGVWNTMQWKCWKRKGRPRCYTASQSCSSGTSLTVEDTGKILTPGIAIAADGKFHPSL